MIQFAKEHFFDICLLIGFLCYALAQYWTGRNDAADKTEDNAARALKIAQGEIEVMDKKITRQAELIIEQGKQVANLQGQISEKDKLLERYATIFQNRDPGMENYIKESVASLKIIANGIEDLLKRPAATAVTFHNEQPKA